MKQIQFGVTGTIISIHMFYMQQFKLFKKDENKLKNDRKHSILFILLE